MTQHESTPRLSRPSHQVALIELNRPRSANRIQPEDLEALEHLLDECESDESIHVLVLAAKGAYFSAGYDLRALVAGFESAESQIPRGDMAFEHFVDRLERSRLIVIAVINGPVFGGATDLALACDLRIGTEAVYLQMPAARFGLPLYAGALQRYVSRLGLNHAKRLVFMAQKIDAAELLAMGFLNELSSSAALQARSFEIADAIAAMPNKPLSAMKQVLNAASLSKGTAKEQREALLAVFDGPEIAKRVRASKSER